jgi:hypothetical protein
VSAHLCTVRWGTSKEDCVPCGNPAEFVVGLIRTCGCGNSPRRYRCADCMRDGINGYACAYCGREGACIQTEPVAIA